MSVESSRVRSVLSVASVGHGGKEVVAAAVLLLRALVADRYSMVQHFLMLYYRKRKVAGFL